MGLAVEVAKTLYLTSPSLGHPQRRMNCQCDTVYSNISVPGSQCRGAQKPSLESIFKCLPVCMCVGLLCIWYPQRTEESVGPYGAGVTEVVSHNVSAGNQTQGLCKRSKCSLPLSTLSNPWKVLKY